MSRSVCFFSVAPVLVLLCASAGAQQELMKTPLSLGAATLTESVSRETLAPGVEHYRIQRGETDKSGGWILMSGVVTSAHDMDRIRVCFDTLSLHPSSRAFQMGANVQQRYHILTGGNYPTRAAALAAEARAKDLQCSLFARHGVEDETNRSGPWLIDVILLKPGGDAVLSVAAARNGADLRRRASGQARDANAMAAINGGFFVRGEEDGFPGQPSGISVLDGQLNSSPVHARPGVQFIQGSGAVRILRKTDVTVYLRWQDGTRTPVDGVNRKPGMVRDCGRDAHDRPVHDYTCRYPDDIVYFPAGSAWMPATRSFAPSVTRFAMRANGVPRRLDPGAAPAPGEALLAVTASSARLPGINARLERGLVATLTVHSDIEGLLSAGSQVVNGGPTLLMAGQEVHDEVAEGWGLHAIDDARHDLLMHDWVNRRAPRTALGIREDGTVLLVAVDGRREDRSVGLTIAELRGVLKSLGARDAINLDGGGSTTMVVAGQLINLPTDTDGERAVGDAILVVPHPNGKQ